jgi:hypothetical protein
MIYLPLFWPVILLIISLVYLRVQPLSQVLLPSVYIKLTAFRSCESDFAPPTLTHQQGTRDSGGLVSHLQ